MEARPLRYWHACFPYLIGLSGLVFWWLATCGRLSQTYDSQQYVAAALSWRTQGLWLMADGRDFVHWPPLLPWLLSWSADPAALAAWLNLSALCVQYVGWWWILCQVLHTRMARYWALAAIAWSLSVWHTATFLWTEATWMALLAVWAALAYKYLDPAVPEVRRSFLWLLMSVLAVGAVLLRQATLLWCLPLAVLALQQQAGRLAATVLPALLVWGYWKYGQPPVESDLFQRSLGQSMLLYTEALGRWLLPQPLPIWVHVVAAWALGCGSLSAVRRLRDRWWTIWQGSAWGYLLLLVWLRPSMEADTDRLAAAAAPFVWIGVAAVGEHGLRHCTAYRRILLRIAFGGWLLYPLGRSIWLIWRTL